jgi:hypothetical protein
MGSPSIIVLSAIVKKNVRKVRSFILDPLVDLYLDMFGSDHMTCYWEILSSGHICEQLLNNDGNVSKFSNQGQEKLNDYMKKAYELLSNKGGGAGKDHIFDP